LRLDQARLPELAFAKRTVCVTANNHVSDFGAEGLLATLQALREARIRSVGAGANLTEARAPLLLDMPGRTIALLAYADTAEHVGAIAATDQTPGVAPLDVEMIISDLRQTAARVKDVWLFLHWGIEFVRYPEPRQRELARAFVEAGATLIVGAHPHVVRGTESIGSAAVCYSLGNFIFPSIPLTGGGVLRWDRESKRSFFLKGTSDGSAWKWEPVPFVLSKDGSPRTPTSREGRSVLQQIDRLSQCLTDAYPREYPSIRRRELARHAAWRIWSMSWGERLGALRRLAPGSASDRSGKPEPFNGGRQ